MSRLERPIRKKGASAEVMKLTRTWSPKRGTAYASKLATKLSKLLRKLDPYMILIALPCFFYN